MNSNEKPVTTFKENRTLLASWLSLFSDLLSVCLVTNCQYSQEHESVEYLGQDTLFHTSDMSSALPLPLGDCYRSVVMLAEMVQDN